eukprot:10258149-Lingulodinium_polyedra.AAC.1
MPHIMYPRCGQRLRTHNHATSPIKPSMGHPVRIQKDASRQDHCITSRNASVGYGCENWARYLKISGGIL